MQHPFGALLNRKFRHSQISNRVKNWYQNVTFGECEICVWSIAIILGVKNQHSKFHIFIFLTCDQSARIRLICEELVRLFSDVTNSVIDICEDLVPIQMILKGIIHTFFKYSMAGIIPN